jgi:histidine triad (HIT) family protein
MDKLVAAATCVFCEIVNGTAPASMVYADRQAVAFMDIQPVNEGHLLVVPRIHAVSLAELDVRTGCHLFRLAMRLSKAVRQSGIRCEGVNLFLADGEAAGQEVFHVHLHVMPRFQGDGFRIHFSNGYYELPGRASLDGIAARIRKSVGD